MTSKPRATSRGATLATWRPIPPVLAVRTMATRGRGRQARAATSSGSGWRSAQVARSSGRRTRASTPTNTTVVSRAAAERKPGGREQAGVGGEAGERAAGQDRGDRRDRAGQQGGEDARVGAVRPPRQRHRGRRDGAHGQAQRDAARQGDDQGAGRDDGAGDEGGDGDGPPGQRGRRAGRKGPVLGQQGAGGEAHQGEGEDGRGQRGDGTGEGVGPAGARAEHEDPGDGHGGGHEQRGAEPGQDDQRRGGPPQDAGDLLGAARGGRGQPREGELQDRGGEDRVREEVERVGPGEAGERAGVGAALGGQVDHEDADLLQHQPDQARQHRWR